MRYSLSLALYEPLKILMDPAPELVNYTQKHIEKSYLPFKTTAGIYRKSE